MLPYKYINSIIFGGGVMKRLRVPGQRSTAGMRKWQAAYIPGPKPANEGQACFNVWKNVKKR